MTLPGFYLTLAFAPLPPVGVPFLFGPRELGRFLVVLVPVVLLMPAVLLYVGSARPHASRKRRRTSR